MPLKRMRSYFLIAALAVCSGCNLRWVRDWESWIPDGWVYDYDRAERRMRESCGGMLIVYGSGDRRSNEKLLAEVKAAADASLPGDFVRCMLFSSYEPDRRYVAQYGVMRAPALILIHPEGTYHAREGTIDQETAREFLSSSKAPGQVPRLNPHIPRESHYVWISSLEAAEASARQTGRSILVVLDRPYTNDWSRLAAMLERREVYVRFANLIHCRPGGLFGVDSELLSRLGVRRLPAIVVIDSTGKAHPFELPHSYDAIARFADRVLYSEDGAEDKAAALRSDAARSATD